MKRLSAARFTRVHKDEERLLVIGPVLRKGEIYYTFGDSLRPHRTATFGQREGEEMVQRQLAEPVLVYHEGSERIYWYQHRFLLCSAASDTPEDVKTWIAQNDDRKSERPPKSKQSHP